MFWSFDTCQNKVSADHIAISRAQVGPYRDQLFFFIFKLTADQGLVVDWIAGSSHVKPGARFSKVPKLYGPLSGVTIPFVFQERRGFESSNSTDVFLLVSLKTYLKIGFPKQAVSNFTNVFSGPKSFRDFRETDP